MNASFCTYNCNGLGPGKINYLQQLCKSHSFVLIQEHWKYSDELPLLENSLCGVNIHGVSGMPSDAHIKGRPYGGCAILWHKRMLGSITPVPSNNNRLCCVLYEDNKCKILIFCVYMPYEGATPLHENDASYSEILSKITELISSYDTDSIVIGGDFNTCFSRKVSGNKLLLTKFLSEESLKPCCEHVISVVDYSYVSYTNGSKYLVDH